MDLFTIQQMNIDENLLFAVNLVMMGYALHEGWSSPGLLSLKSEGGLLPGSAINKDEATWVTTLFPIGSVIGCLAYAYILNYFGRKTLLLFNAIPIIVRIKTRYNQNLPF